MGYGYKCKKCGGDMPADIDALLKANPLLTLTERAP